MAIKRNLASTGLVVVCALAGVALLASSLLGKSPEEQKREKQAAALAKDLGTGGGVDPKAVTKKLTDEVKTAEEDKKRREAAKAEEDDRAKRENAAKELAIAKARGLPVGGGMGGGANGYPTGTPNGGFGTGAGSGSGTAVQNMSADEQVRMAREIEANTLQAAQRGAKTAAFEDSSVVMVGSEGYNRNGGNGAANSNAASNRAARSAGLPSIEELTRMGAAAAAAANGNTANGGSSGASGGSGGLDGLRDALRAQALSQGQPTTEPTTAQRNANFMKDAAAGAAKSERDKATAGSFPRAPLSKYMVTEGWAIPAVLAKSINSDLAGDMSAIVTQRVYDSVSGSVCLIPMGARLIGKYNSEVTAGQQRLLFAFTGLYYPNGTYVPLGAMNGADAGGASGLAGDVNNHFWRIFGSSVAIAAVSTAAGVVSARSSSNNVAINVGSTIAGNASGVLSDVTKKMLERNTSIKPTISLGVGEKFLVSIAHDLVLPPYVTNTNCN